MARIRTTLAAIMFMFALGGGLAAQSATANAAAIGVNVAATSGDFFHSAKVIHALRASRPAWVRVFLGWNALEPAQGTYLTSEIAAYASFFAKLPPSTKIDIDVWGSPAWANGGSSNIATPPTDPATYAAFVNYLVNAWEIWNEEDESGWWTGSPAQYVGLLKATYPAIKSVDRNATVLVGGLTGNDGAYLQQMYGAGAEGSFDGVGVHTDTACNIASPYDFEYNPGTHTINQYFFLGFVSIHAAMTAAGDGAKPIYMTEVGWSSTSAECQTGHWAGKKAAGVSPQTQATFLRQAYHCLAQPRYGYVKAAMWFELVNDGTSSQPLDNFGLLDRSGNPKPAFAAFADISRHGDRLSGPCGDFTPPAITIMRPSSGHTYRGPLRIAVRASDPAAGVAEITIRLSRTSRFHFFSRHFAKAFSRRVTWLGAATLPPGPHRIRIVVTDKLGNTARTTVTFTHAATHGRRATPRRR